MLDLFTLGQKISQRRKDLLLRQIDLAAKAEVSRATIANLESGRIRELGFSRLAKILAVLGLDLTLGEAGTRRPTLEELIQEDMLDQGLGRRS